MFDDIPFREFLMFILFAIGFGLIFLSVLDYFYAPTSISTMLSHMSFALPFFILSYIAGKIKL